MRLASALALVPLLLAGCAAPAPDGPSVLVLDVTYEGRVSPPAEPACGVGLDAAHVAPDALLLPREAWTDGTELVIVAEGEIEGDAGCRGVLTSLYPALPSGYAPYGPRYRIDRDGDTLLVGPATLPPGRLVTFPFEESVNGRTYEGNATYTNRGILPVVLVDHACPWGDTDCWTKQRG